MLHDRITGEWGAGSSLNTIRRRLPKEHVTCKLSPVFSPPGWLLTDYRAGSFRHRVLVASAFVAVIFEYVRGAASGASAATIRVNMAHDKRTAGEPWQSYSAATPYIRTTPS